MSEQPPQSGPLGDLDRVEADEVRLRLLTVRGLPLVIAALGRAEASRTLREMLIEKGLAPIEAFLGVDLPRGAGVGFAIDGDQLRLVDDGDATLLRAPRSGVDEGWLEGARRLRGTMAVVVEDLELDGEAPPAEVAGALDVAARDGRALGAIIGVSEERPTLPLLSF